MGFDTSLSRKDFLGGLAGGLLLPWALEAQQATASGPVLSSLEPALGLSLSEEERKRAAGSFREFESSYRQLREAGIGYGVAPATPFVPLGRQPEESRRTRVPLPDRRVDLPSRDDDLPFLTVAELARLIRSRQLTSVRLTQACLNRLERFGPELFCLITLLREEAMAEAEQADADIRRGRWKGPLHGIPYTLKDLFATKGHKTTWGAAPFKDQVTDFDSEVVIRLRKAGAILVAKVTLGALAMDDKWYGGQTRNPWNPEQGSSGSSAGSASSVAAGLVPFAIGTETLGSIVSPSHRCRVTGLRPTFGRVSRHGAMALSWTMDKAGPIGRTAEDCLLVLAAIHGADPQDTGSVDRPLLARSLKDLKVGYLEDEKPLDEEDSSRQEWLALLARLGVKADPIKVTPPEDAASLGLSVEAAAAFDAITRSGVINTVDRSFWPDIFRSNRFVTAVEYVQSLRLRTMMMERFEREFGDYDVILAGDRGSHLLITTNLTGHPQLYVPLGPDRRGRARGLSIIGRLYDEGAVCALGQAIQDSVKFHVKRPEKFD